MFESNQLVVEEVDELLLRVSRGSQYEDVSNLGDICDVGLQNMLVE